MAPAVPRILAAWCRRGANTATGGRAMGQAARRKRTRQAESARVSETRLGALSRELREALTARARSLRSGMPDDAGAERVAKASDELEALLGAEDTDDPLRGADPSVLGFVADVGAVSAVFAATELDPDPETAEAIEDAAEQLMAFEELPLGSRLGAVANDREVAGFVAAASLALGPQWDPFDPDPYGLTDLAALAAGLAVARAFLLTFEALVEPAREEALRGAVEAAGTLLAGAEPEVRELVLDDMASPAWVVARAVTSTSGCRQACAGSPRSCRSRSPLAPSVPSGPPPRRTRTASPSRLPPSRRHGGRCRPRPAPASRPSPSSPPTRPASPSPRAATGSGARPGTCRRTGRRRANRPRRHFGSSPQPPVRGGLDPGP
jgi:hypothetical protein